MPVILFNLADWVLPTNPPKSGSIIQSCKNKIYSDSGKSVYGSTQKINDEHIICELAREFIKNLTN